MDSGIGNQPCMIWCLSHGTFISAAQTLFIFFNAIRIWPPVIIPFRLIIKDCRCPASILFPGNIGCCNPFFFSVCSLPYKPEFYRIRTFLLKSGVIPCLLCRDFNNLFRLGCITDAHIAIRSDTAAAACRNIAGNQYGCFLHSLFSGFIGMVIVQHNRSIIMQGPDIGILVPLIFPQVWNSAKHIFCNIRRNLVSQSRYTAAV